ncbi:Putative SOS response-associated peptidase YedK [bacterium HR29]|nr:Putative SOS response-associated peptidase YedK [bacterium HR29]
MCGRITLTYRDRRELAEALGVDESELPADYRPRYNIAPRQDHFVLRERHEERELLVANWGLVPRWAKDDANAYKTINARAETLHTSRLFRDAFFRRRCLVPVDGFYEWAGPKGRRQPIWFHRPDGRLFFLAGLYEFWKPEGSDEWRATFTIVTTAANALIARIHDRMPVVLPDDLADVWLHTPPAQALELRQLLRPAPETLLVPRPVSPRVNDVTNDDPSLLEEVPLPAPLFA